jgi:prolyl oligopeptidase PreP (S9A serine peptidase family)
VLQPAERETILGVAVTRDHMLVGMLRNVRGELRRYRFSDGRWAHETVPAPELGSINIAATSALTNRYFFTYSGYTQPTTLYVFDPETGVREVKRLPEQFDTRDLERGGVYVVANIRGGGEFGPAWHRAALKENRQRAYDDFIAVAEDLIARKITSPQRLGIMGGSNGGLLVGAALTQRPDLFNAVVIQVPLLDMQRYHRLLAGASWMAEYGDPDKPEEWAYISKYSPYHNVKAGVQYPRVLFTTTTRDDRVHPGHARKMAAKMESLGIPFYYFENTEGGHGAGVTNEQRAKLYALEYAYLRERLGVRVRS